MVVDDILIALFLATLMLFAFARYEVERIAHNHYHQKADFYANHAVKPEDIVFYGDSITDGANWDELFPGLPVKARGINADTSEGVLERIPNSLRGHPKAIFVLIGTNDLPLFEYRTDRKILATYEEILKMCKSMSPETKVYVQSILPRMKGFAKRITSLNASLEQLAKKYDYTFINLFPHFATDEGQLRNELTNDHLHLMAAGYDIWVRKLAPYIEELTRPTAAS